MLAVELSTAALSTGVDNGCPELLVGLFMCLLCNRCFQRGCDLARHFKATGHDQPPGQVQTALDLVVGRGRIRSRKRRTWRYKRDRILDYMQLRADPNTSHKAQLLVANRCGLDLGLLGRWIQDRDRVFSFARTPRLGNMRGFQPFNPKWPQAELRLYAHFVYRRRVKAKRVTRMWLKKKLAEIRADLGHQLPSPTWLPSGGYISRFCQRWNISSQCRTNKKKMSIQERLPQMQAFHQYWIQVVQCMQPERDKKYGRYGPNEIYAMDQVPMAFSCPTNKTLEVKGAPAGCRSLGIHEDDKRMCTLNITLCANPSGQDVRIEVIFRGLGPENGGRIDQQELDLYAQHPNVKVRWQKKAWADHGICLDYILDFREQTIGKGPVALFMDRHGSQQTPMVRMVMDILDIKYVFTPANCTDCVSPVDRNVGQALKQKIYKMQEHELDLEGNEHWRLPVKEGGLEAWQKRTMIVAWVDRAWEELKKERHLLLSSFVETGILISKDGTEDHLIKLHPKHTQGMYKY